MARALVTPQRLPIGDNLTDLAESTTSIDQPNGMRVVVLSKIGRLGIRITNTSASPRQVTVKAPAGAGNPRGAYGAAGPSGSNPSEPDYTTTGIAATTGVRLLSVPSRYVQSDGSVWLDFPVGHTGTVSAFESA